MTLVNAILVLAAAGLAAPALLAAIQIFAALLPRRPPPEVAGAPVRYAVLMPAHDEAEMIGATLDALLPQVGASGRVLVVADNCSDETARIARSRGVEVAERADARRRGKGYALDFGVAALAGDPPDVVIVMDADCRLATDGGLPALASLAHRLGRPVQSVYLMAPAENADVRQRIAAFAMRVKSWLRPLGASRLGMPVQLGGTGMAFPYTVLRQVPIASGHIVEDLQYGLACAEAGFPPAFHAGVRVDSAFPSSEEGRASQRERWEHGHLSVLLGEVPRHVARAVRTGRPGLLMMALDAAVPPLALLIALLAAALGLGFLWGLATAAWSAFAVAGLGLFVLGVAVLTAWARVGREVLPAAELLHVPGYVLGKFGLYRRFLKKPQSEWVRTRRD